MCLPPWFVIRILLYVELRVFVGQDKMMTLLIDRYAANQLNFEGYVLRAWLLNRNKLRFQPERRDEAISLEAL